LAALREGDGFTEKISSAPIDEFASGDVPLTLIRDQGFGRETLKQVSYDLPLVNDTVLRFPDYPSKSRSQRHGGRNATLAATEP
jgi:hypothetical protein